MSCKNCMFRNNSLGEFVAPPQGGDSEAVFWYAILNFGKRCLCCVNVEWCG